MPGGVAGGGLRSTTQDQGAGTPAIAAIVLAAGAASRFGSPKALAPLEGRPLLEHVLDALARAPISRVVVVLGDAGDEIERAIHWRDETRVKNPNPELGLASSLHVGLEAVAGLSDPDVSAALVVLGDQPRLRPDVIEARRRLARGFTPDRRAALRRERDAQSGAARARGVAERRWPRPATAGWVR